MNVLRQTVFDKFAFLFSALITDLGVYMEHPRVNQRVWKFDYLCWNKILFFCNGVWIKDQWQCLRENSNVPFVEIEPTIVPYSTSKLRVYIWNLSLTSNKNLDEEWEIFTGVMECIYSEVWCEDIPLGNNYPWKLTKETWGVFEDIFINIRSYKGRVSDPKTKDISLYSLLHFKILVNYYKRKGV